MYVNDEIKERVGSDRAIGQPGDAMATWVCAYSSNGLGALHEKTVLAT